MRVEENLCDIKNCSAKAVYQIKHVRLDDERWRTLGWRELVIDLCQKHAEQFTLKGTGAWETTTPLNQP